MQLKKLGDCFMKIRDLKIILKKYIIAVFPIIVVFLFINNYIANIQIDKISELILGEQKQSISTINYIINTKFEEIRDDINIIKNSDEITKYLDEKSDTNLYEAEQLIYRIATNKKNFCRIRYIDSSGLEIISIENKNGQVKIVEKSNLSYQDDKKYYQDIKVLEDGEMYVSEMELHFSELQFNVVYEPIIRIATPIFVDGVYDGFIIINYIGDEILEIFNENFENSEFSFVEHVLVNKDGYYLYNINSNKTFGFMFEERKDITMEYEYSNLWKHMSTHDESEYYVDDYIYYYKKIFPLNFLRNDNIYKWYIVTRFNMNDLPLLDQYLIFGLNLSDVFILFGICLLVFAFVSITYYRKKDVQKFKMVSTIVENISDATIITDNKTNIIFANKAFEDTTGYNKRDIIGKKTSYFKSGLQSSDFYKKMWAEINKNGYWSGELWDKKKDGMLYPKKLSIMRINNSENVEYEYLGIFTDLTDNCIKKHTVNKLKNYSLDMNIPKPNLLANLFDLDSLENNKIAVISFSIINYNELIFKNDKYVDDIILSFVNLVHDKIMGDSFVAKVSRNVFIIGINNIVDIDIVYEYIDRFFEKIDYLNGKDSNLYFDIKAGLAIYPRDGSSPEDVINNANLALEYSTNNGQNRFSCYNNIVKENLQREINIKTLLRSAIEKEELYLNYQPQLDSRENKIIGAEALIRWKSDKLGLVSPSEFIDIAEDIGMIKDLGYWVIEKVFSDYHMLKDIVDENFRISINLSTTQFNDENIIEIFRDFSKKYDISLNKLEIELTENVFVENINMVNMKMKKFKDLGMSIAIDDFGTGFSSFSYLKQLSIDKIKIDRIFIKDYPNEDDGIIANVMTNMSNKLDIKVIAEGVDKIEQLDYLKSINCFEIQGYYFSEPLTIEKLVEYIEKNMNG